LTMTPKQLINGIMLFPASYSIYLDKGNEATNADRWKAFIFKWYGPAN